MKFEGALLPVRELFIFTANTGGRGFKEQLELNLHDCQAIGLNNIVLCLRHRSSEIGCCGPLKV